MRITGAGSVGIGTTSPLARLEVDGSGTGDVAVSGANNSRAGVKGLSTSGDGVDGISSSGYGVYGTSVTNYAGYFAGNVKVTGTCCAAAVNVAQIDHPLNPANQTLQQALVESPEMKTVYDGNVRSDANGVATIALPDYAEALGGDFRYQLTVIGQFAQAIVSSEIQHNQFGIKTDKPNVKVSWQVTGIRKDPYAVHHPIVAEQDKPAAERGKYLHPEVYGQPETMGVDYEKRTALSQPATGGTQ